MSLRWPLAKATIIRSWVDKKNTGEFGIAYRLEVWFTYLVDERPYQGTYGEQFPHQIEADRLLASLKEGPFLVRYNPSVPGDYFIDPYRDVRNDSAPAITLDKLNP